MNGKILNKEALKAWILSKMVTLTNNLLATTPGISAMDAAQGPVIQGQIDAINSNLGGLSFGLTEDGQPGWKDGADTVHPFNDIMYITGSTNGSGLTGSVKIQEGYRLLMGIMSNGLSPGGQAGAVYWNGQNYVVRNFTHITVSYDRNTNIFSGTSSPQANTASKNWQMYVASVSYFANR